MIKDYRINRYTKVDFSLGNKKENFMIEFKKKHPKAKNIYKFVQKRQTLENRLFRRIYNDRCVYCGVSTQVVASSSFEIDHVLAQANCPEGYLVNSIDNLVCACSMCNRCKSDYRCSEQKHILIHPDNNNLPSLFFRDELYYIRIDETYTEDEEISSFYRELKLDNELRRIDFFIMELKDFCRKYKDDELILKIKEIIEKVEQKRRNTF